jgi:hypothetical protein
VGLRTGGSTAKIRKGGTNGGVNVALLAERGMEGEDTGAMNRGWPCRRPGRTTRWGTGTAYDRLEPRVEVWGTTVRLIKKSRGHEVCCHGVAGSGQGETVGSIRRNGEPEDGDDEGQTNERIGEGAPRRRLMGSTIQRGCSRRGTANRAGEL